jgi:hypothetical protein
MDQLKRYNQHWVEIGAKTNNKYLHYFSDKPQIKKKEEKGRKHVLDLKPAPLTLGLVLPVLWPFI